MAEDVTVATPTNLWGITNPGGNATSSSITKPISTTFSPESDPPPSGVALAPDGVIRWGDGGSASSSGLKISFYGVGSDTNLGLASVYGWEGSIISGSAFQKLWVPTLLASFSFELDSGQPGVNGTLISATNYFATTITLITGNSGISVEVVSPGHGNDIAHAIIDTKGARFIEVRFGLDSSATSLNAMWKKM
jgi:hypothetical protein